MFQFLYLVKYQNTIHQHTLFSLNVQLFPDDGNLWDSLGEAYLKYGRKEEAIKSYQKAVKLGNESSSKQLQKLLN